MKEMTPDDRELLAILRRQQAELRDSLAHIDKRLDQLEARSREDAPAAAVPPPPPAMMPPLPPIPADAPASAKSLPPLPHNSAATSALPPIPPQSPPPPPSTPLPPVPHASFEFRFGRWLTRIGAAFGVITLALILSLTHAWIFKALGPVGILAFSAAL